MNGQLDITTLIKATAAVLAVAYLMVGGIKLMINGSGSRGAGEFSRLVIRVLLGLGLASSVGLIVSLVLSLMFKH